MADSNIDHWQHTLGGATAEQLSDFASGTSGNGNLKAFSTNSGTIYVGKNGVTSSNGYPLEPGGSVNIRDLLASNKLYIIGTSGDKVAYLGTTI